MKLQPPIEGSAADPESTGRRSLAPDLLQDQHDVFALDRIQVRPSDGVVPGTGSGLAEGSAITMSRSERLWHAVRAYESGTCSLAINRDPHVEEKEGAQADLVAIAR